MLPCGAKSFAITILVFFFSLSFSPLFLDGLPKVVLGKFYYSLPRKCVTKIGLIPLETLKKVSVKTVPKFVIRDVCGT